MAQSILYLPGWSGGAQTIPGLEGILEKKAHVLRLEPRADVFQVREAFRSLGGPRVSVVSMGSGWIQALLLAQAFPVKALALVAPGADGRREGFLLRHRAAANLFAVVAPTLVARVQGDRTGYRLFRGLDRNVRKMILLDKEKYATQTILQHLCPNEAIDSLAKEHDFGII